MGAQASATGLEPVADGLYRFDTGYIRPRHTACFVAVHRDRAAIIDCGVARNVGPLLAALEECGIAPAAVEAVIVTHAHLDHAGGAGQLMAGLPGAHLLGHPSAVRHLADPVRLEQGVRAVYGDEFFDREYGELLPVAADRVIEAPDGHAFMLGDSGRELRMLHTPGHARHHVSIFDVETATVFAGDAFGIGYPELDGPDGRFFVPETPPNQFDPEAMHASIDRIAELDPDRVEPTHFGTIEDVATVATALHSMLDASVERALAAESVEDVEAALLDLYAGWLVDRGRPERDIEVMRALYALDAHLAAQGLWHWREKRERAG